MLLNVVQFPLVVVWLLLGQIRIHCQLLSLGCISNLLGMGQTSIYVIHWYAIWSFNLIEVSRVVGLPLKNNWHISNSIWIQFQLQLIINVIRFVSLFQWFKLVWVGHSYACLVNNRYWRLSILNILGSFMSKIILEVIFLSRLTAFFAWFLSVVQLGFLLESFIFHLVQVLLALHFLLGMLFGVLNYCWCHVEVTVSFFWRMLQSLSSILLVSLTGDFF